MKLLNESLYEIKKSKFIGYTAGKSDDGEPNNTCGLPIYNLLERKGLTNRLIVVVRYFGGTKLGAGNLLRSYIKAATDSINE